jgi:FXSXX-COOH protein
MADLRDIPLSELPALGMDVLGAAIGRVLPDPVAGTARAGAFQSSI